MSDEKQTVGPGAPIPGELQESDPSMDIGFAMLSAAATITAALINGGQLEMEALEGEPGIANAKVVIDYVDQLTRGIFGGALQENEGE